MPFLQVPLGRLYYETAGEGRSLGLLHGMWSNHGAWKRMLPRLSDTHRVVAPDFMGHGRSDRMAVSYQLSTYASDLKILFDHLGIEKISLAGFSLGSLVAQAFYDMWPARVGSLILIATPPPQKLRWKLGIRFVSFLEKLHLTSLKKESFKALARRHSRSSGREEVEKSLKELHNYEDKEFARILRSVWGGKERRPASAILVPTLVAVGGEDGIRAHSEHLHRSIPGSRLLIVPRSGHSLVLDRPTLLAEEILKFLQEAGSRA